MFFLSFFFLLLLLLLLLLLVCFFVFVYVDSVLKVILSGKGVDKIYASGMLHCI